MKYSKKIISASLVVLMLHGICLTSAVSVSAYGTTVYETKTVENAEESILDSEITEVEQTQKIATENEESTEVLSERENIPEDEILSISLNRKSLIVGVDETFNFVCTTDKGKIADVTYTSSQTEVAIVDSNGNMRALSTGTAVITAKTINGKEANCRITVKNAPTSISINRKNSIMGLGETFYLEGSLPNDEASRVMTFSSGNPSVATVNESGIVTAKSIGTAIVSITTYNGQKATCRVTVRKAPTSIDFNHRDVTLAKGETLYLESLFNTGEYARTVTYNSPNKAVATISGSGVIMAKNTGTVNITGKTYNGKSATCKVTVKNAPENIHFNDSSVTIEKGKSFNTSLIFNKNEISNQIKYRSKNPYIAKVDSKGIITAINGGQTSIIAETFNGKQTECTVTVIEMPTKITMEKDYLMLGIGEVCTLKVKSDKKPIILNADSDKPSVASVTMEESSCKITAKSKGVTFVTVSSLNGISARCKIVVKSAPTEIFLNKTELTLGVNETFQLDGHLEHSESATITYSSSNPSVADVDSKNGMITAHKTGTVRITASVYNGVKNVCNVTVKSAPTQLYLNKTELTLNVGETFDLNSSLKNGEGAYHILYSSDNSSVASVKSAGGLVTALKEGTATITATAYNGKKVSCIVTVIDGVPITTVVGSVIKDKPLWAAKTVGNFNAGTVFRKISTEGNWIKIKYNDNIAYIYNRAVNNKANYSTISETTLGAYVDDWFFLNGTSIDRIYYYARGMSYMSMAEGSSIESMCVYILRYRTGACYQRAAILYYMLNRAGYEVKYVKGVDYYTGGSPHRWCMINTASGWRHIDPTPVIGLPSFYLVTDYAISPYFGWDRTIYPKAV